jgi:spore coat protein CotF
MITEEEIKTIEALADKYIRKSDCKLTEAANIEFRKGLKKRIIELLEMRDQTKPYSPILQKK